MSALVMRQVDAVRNGLNEAVARRAKPRLADSAGEPRSATVADLLFGCRQLAAGVRVAVDNRHGAASLVPTDRDYFIETSLAILKLMTQVRVLVNEGRGEPDAVAAEHVATFDEAVVDVRDLLVELREPGEPENFRIPSEDELRASSMAPPQSWYDEDVTDLRGPFC